MDRVTADQTKELMGLPLRSHLMVLASHTNRRQMVGECVRSLMSGALVVLLLAAPAWAAPMATPAPGVLYPLLPNTALTAPTYDYAAAETCTGCHYISLAEGDLPALDHTSRVFGVWLQPAAAVNASCTAGPTSSTVGGTPYACCTGNGTGTCGDTWQLTGSGWLASRHSQSDYATTENGFCAKCHSPLQAYAPASFSSGAVVNAPPVPQQRFQAVTCGTCHPPYNISAQIGVLNPGSVAGIAIYLWKGYNNPASYQTLSTGVNSDGTSKEDLLCLNCHEQRHDTDNSAMWAMMTTTYNHLIPGGGPVRCIDCHMSEYRYIIGSSGLTEVFHDWNVGADLPYSCGAVGSVSLCHVSSHSTFTVADAQNLIPFIKEQHGVGLTGGVGGDWWSLPPFNGVVQAVVPAHGAPTLVEFKTLEREISKIDAM
jgi:hypothetical protein